MSIAGSSSGAAQPDRPVSRRAGLRRRRPPARSDRWRINGSWFNGGMAPLTSQPPIRLMLIDDHPVLRAGLANLLAIEEGLAVVAQAGSGEVAIQLCRRHGPDICLLDLSMPGIGGLATLERLLEVAACRIIVLTSSESAADAARALAGAATATSRRRFPSPRSWRRSGRCMTAGRASARASPGGRPEAGGRSCRPGNTACFCSCAGGSRTPRSAGRWGSLSGPPNGT